MTNNKHHSDMHEEAEAPEAESARAIEAHPALAQTPAEKALEERYEAAKPCAGKSVSPKHTGVGCNPLVSVERIRAGGRILTCTDETGATTLVFLSRRNAQEIGRWLLPSDDDAPTLTAKDWKHALRNTQRERYKRGEFENGKDVAAVRRFAHLSQVDFARAIGVSVHTVSDWEHDRRPLDARAIAILRVAARSPWTVYANAKIEAVASTGSVR